VNLAYRVVDVFTDVPFAGNALCVVLDSCPESLMAPIAREVNLRLEVHAADGDLRVGDGVVASAEGRFF